MPTNTIGFVMLLLCCAAMMATVITGIPTSLRRPQTFHVFTYLLGGRSLVPLPMRVALIGVKTAAGTGASGTIYEIPSTDVSDGLFGVGSELALMCRKAFETAAYLGFGPAVFAVSVDEPGAGTANVKTITATGTATGSGNLIVRIAGRTHVIGVSSGDVQNTIATAISNVLKQYSENLPVSISVATNVVTLTHRYKGENGGDLVVTVDYSNVPGVTLAVANTVVGAGVASPQTAFDNLAGLDFDGIAIANHKSADITIINGHIATAWGPSEKKWRWVFVGETGSIGTATTLAASANHQAVVIHNIEASPSMTGELATALCMGAFSRERPNANYDGLKLPLYPPPDASAFTSGEVESAISAGLTASTPIIDPTTKTVVQGVMKVERMITTKTTSGGNPFEPLRDLGVSRTGAYLARQVDIAYTSKFGADANPDGVLLTDDTIDQVRDMIANLLYDAQDQRIVKNVGDDLKKLIVEEDAIAVGRVNADISYTVVVGLHQVAFIHRVIL